jgi:Cu/Ag efflux protein CusF
MALRPSILIVASLVLISACRKTTYETQGDLISLDADGATIAHEKIPGLMDAMTMRFPARPASILDGAQPGTRVRLELVREGDALILVGLEPLGMARGTTPGMHDHRPRFGGVVSMIGLVHVEVTASPDGRVRAYLSDLWRRPLAARDTVGTVRLNLPSETRTLTFKEVGDALEARTTPFGVDSTIANVALVRRGQPLEMNVLLDLTGNRAGVSLVPQTGCVAPDPMGGGGRAPRCAVTFSSTFTAMGTTPDGARVIVAVSHGATSVWSLPDATVVMGVDPLPPVMVPHGAHEPDPRIIAVRSDGDEIVVTAGSRMVFFDAATGRFRRQLEGPGGAIAGFAWLPDGARALVATAADGKAHLIDAGDARIVRTIAGEGQVIVVAVDATGRWAAAGTDVGTLLIADLGSDAPPRVLTPSLQPLAAVAFAGDRVVTAGTDGTLRLFDPANGRETARASVGTSLALLAVAPDGRHAVTADVERTIRVHRLPDGAVVERLDWHRATIGVLAWGAGPTIVAGDNDGTLAVWDVPAPDAPRAMLDPHLSTGGTP